MINEVIKYIKHGTVVMTFHKLMATIFIVVAMLVGCGGGDGGSFSPNSPSSSTESSSSEAPLPVQPNDPSLTSITLTANTFLMVANGTSSPELTISFTDENGNSVDESTVDYQLHANDVLQPTTGFTTMLAGDYSLKIVSNGIESNAVDVRAREQKTYLMVEIPVIYHIVHFAEAHGTGNNLLASEVEAALNRLNAAFSNQMGSRDPNAVDTFIRFRLAHFDPDGAPLLEPGIRRLDGTAYDDGAGLMADRDFPDDRLFGLNEIWALMSQTFWDPRDYLNIWVYPDYWDGGGASRPTMLSSNPLPGLRDFPKDYEPWPENFGGLNMDKDIFIGTGPHEVGHAFGLLHPFSLGVCGDGDYVDDTYNHLIDRETKSPCPGNQGLEESTTFMHYRVGRRKAFTYGQRERMRKVLEYGIWIRDLPASAK